MLPATDAVGTLVTQGVCEALTVGDVAQRLSLDLLDFYALNIGGTSTARQHNLGRFELWKEQIALDLPEVVWPDCHLQMDAVITVVDETDFKVGEVVPDVLGKTALLEPVLHHVEVELRDLLVREKLEG